MSILRSVARALSPSGTPAWFRSQLNEPGAADLYRSFRQYCSAQSYGCSQPYPTETVEWMWRWTLWCFGPAFAPSLQEFYRRLQLAGESMPPSEHAVVHPALFDAIARATRGMARREHQDIRTREQAAAFIDRRIAEHQQERLTEPFDHMESWNHHDQEASQSNSTASEPTSFRPVHGSASERDHADKSIDELADEINRLLHEEPQDEADPRVAELEDQVRLLEERNRQLFEVVTDRSVANVGATQRIRELEQTVHSQEEQIARLRKAGKAVIAQREEWKARAVAAEEALDATKRLNTNRDDKVAALRRLIVKELHPDHSNASAVEKAVRQEFFKIIWPKVEELSQTSGPSEG